MTMIEHADDCAAEGDEECEPSFMGVWNQPCGVDVEEAMGQLPDSAPWCRIQRIAWELSGE